MKNTMKVWLVSLLAITMLAVGCGGPAKTVSATNPAKLKIALLPDESPSTVIKNNEKLKEYLASVLKKDVELIVTTDYSSMIEAMRKGQIDIAYFGPLSYILLKQKMADVEPFAAKLEKGSPTYQGVIIASADSGISELSDIKGKTMAYGDQASTSSHLIPKQILLENKLKAGQDYKEVFVGAHDAVLKAVQNGNAQAGGLSKPIYDQLVENKIVDTAKVKVIKLSPQYPNYPWVMRTSLDKNLQENIRQAFYGLKDTAILKTLKADGFASIQDKDYDVIRNMVKILGIDLEKAQ